MFFTCTCTCRSSIGDTVLHKTGNEFLNGSATLPHHHHHHHQDVPSSVSLSTPGVPTRSQSVKPRLNMSRDSLNSDSSDSDVMLNRRSDSTDRHDVSNYDILDLILLFFCFNFSLYRNWLTMPHPLPHPIVHLFPSLLMTMVTGDQLVRLAHLLKVNLIN